MVLQALPKQLRSGFFVLSIGVGTVTIKTSLSSNFLTSVVKFKLFLFISSYEAISLVISRP